MTRRILLGLAFALLSAAHSLPAQNVTEFQLLDSLNGVWGITAGGDDNTWFTCALSNIIGYVSASGNVTMFLGAPWNPFESFGSTWGPDGALWFLQWDYTDLVYKMGRVTSAGALTTFPLPDKAPGSFLVGVTSGPDGAFWYTNVANSSIGRMTPDGAVTTFPLAVEHENLGGSIVAGSDGALWFTIFQHVGRITTNGQVTLYALSDSAPQSITEGPDGNMWVTEVYSKLIARVTPQGSVTEFPIPTSPAWGIAPGPDGALWFTEPSAKQIGRITTDGVVSEYPSPAAPTDIVAARDGTLWFLESLLTPDSKQIRNRLARLEIQPARCCVSAPPRRPNKLKTIQPRPTTH